ncbi:Sec8 exocyst complex component-specific domain-containing protein [Kalaharituber pfeilii]|nr:Sec8 exocyst complex component-specific domain-containing protein [Kalaharituber pfeilii]
MMGDNCVPVKVALELMDTSSLGRAHMYESFKYTHKELQQALQSIVNDYHQGFNSSIGTYHSIMRSITASQEKVRGLREQLLQAKSDLSANKPEVKNLVLSSQRYDDMLRALTAMEQLQLVPEKLEARISEKRFLTAVQLLSDSLKTIKQPEMMEIGALGDLRVYLSNQEVSLSDILIEELHNHLYLKSLYCVDRWKPYNPNDNVTVPAQRPLHKFLASVDLLRPMAEDGGNKNPEADSLSYIRLLLESLNNLGYLSNAISTINQRLPVELFKLVDKTNQEVDQRHPSSLLGFSRKRKMGKTLDLGLGENDVRVTVLYDLLWTLYSKFEAVMEGHRIVYDVVKGISKRENWTDTTLTNGFVEVWQLLQSEMRSLLHDYLTANDNGGASHAPKNTQNINNIVAGKAARDKKKSVFKLNSADYNSPKMKKDQDDLEAILKASVPGLVSESLRPAATSSEAQSSADGAATGHKLLIEPSVFNMGLLLPPSLAFLQRIKEIVPAGSGIALSTLTSFLDDFSVNVFLPSLDDTMHDLFSQVAGDIDAFQQDANWMAIANKPIMKGTASFFNLITAFCKMLETIPPDQAFGELIIDLLTSYYGKCCDWYKELVSRNRASSADEALGEMKVSARWAHNKEIKEVMGAIWTADDIGSGELLERENALELKTQGDTPIPSADLVKDCKTISALCILYTSLKWLASKTTQLRQVEDSDAFARETTNSSSGRGSSGPGSGRRRRRWTLGKQPKQPLAEETPPMLPMSKDTVVLFDGVVNSYQELASTVLFTLRAETRCRVIHHLHLCLSSNSFNVPSISPNANTSTDNPNAAATTPLPHHDPDPNLLNLNADLVAFDEDISGLLREREKEYISRGLGSFMDHILVSQAGKIKILSKGGCEKMRLNILVLQQNLKNIEKGVRLERARRYYGLFLAGAKVSNSYYDILDKARSGTSGFSYDELKTIISLYYSEPLTGRKESVMQTRKSMNDMLLALSEIMIVKEG